MDYFFFKWIKGKSILGEIFDGVTAQRVKGIFKVNMVFIGPFQWYIKF